MNNTCTISGTSVFCSMMKLNGNSVGERICSVEGCDNKHRAKGFCSSHYSQMDRSGKITKIRKPERHGMANTRAYRVWKGLRYRCSNENLSAYIMYGGRGIRVCDRWDNSFLAFYEDMGERPTEKHSIDRIDNDKGYSPENCRWATSLEQMQNTRTCNRIIFEGESYTIRNLSTKLGINMHTMQCWVNRGKDLEASISNYTKKGLIKLPPKETLSSITL